jgi:hypothetical protein
MKTENGIGYGEESKVSLKRKNELYDLKAISK